MVLNQTPSPRVSLRRRTLTSIALIVLLYAALLIASPLLGDTGTAAVLADKNLPPSLTRPFGADWLGRDMLARTVQGLALSVSIGLLAAAISAALGAALGVIAATAGGVVDGVISWLIDALFSVPHFVLLILIAFAMGGGVRGVIIAVAFTHWGALARITRADVLQLKSADYVQISARFGHSPLWIAWHHMLPHLAPQFLVGLILLFPHAILHEAGLSFVGIGISPHLPAIGVMLADSMRQLSAGHWWVAVMPGLSLLIVVKLFDVLGEHVRALIDPRTRQQ